MNEPGNTEDAREPQDPNGRGRRAPDAAGDGADAASSDAAAPGEGAAAPRRGGRRRGRRGGRRHRPAGARAPASGATASDDAAPAAREPAGGSRPPAAAAEPAPRREENEPESGVADRPAGAAPAPRKRTRRGGRGRRRPTRPAAEGADGTEGVDGARSVKSAAGSGDADGAATAARSHPPRRASADAESKATAENGEGAAPRRKRRRRRGSGAKPAGKGPAPEPALDAEEEAPAGAAGDRGKKAPARASTRLAAAAARRQQSRQQRRRPRTLSETEARALRGGKKVMLVHEHEDRTQIAILEERVLIEHYVAHKKSKAIAGNIYNGKVQNVLPGMEAAFVDVGRGRNAVLYAGEVNYSAEDLEGEAPRIEKVLRSGQSIMVQVTKDPLGSKGARLTTQISLPGRYVVLTPDQPLTGISRRLAENERARLRKILREILPSKHGVIVRTAAEGASKEALERDLQYLLHTWEEVQKASKKKGAPALLYQEPEIATRVVREIVADDVEQIIVDSRGVYDRLRDYVEQTSPEILDRLKLYEGRLPLFEEFHVVEQIHKALERKVWLPSGGSIVIDRTEAMTVIDVNTGKFVGKSTLEETVLKTNTEAAEEIARQLRLRDIGGIILIDFIDMLLESNRNEVLRTLKRALSRDKTRSQVGDVSALGLVEMTRKKVSEGLLDAFSEPCPNCQGRGIVLTHDIE